MPLYSNFFLYQMSVSGGSGFPVDWNNDVIKCALFPNSASAYIMNCSAITHWAGIATGEISGVGYAASGKAVSGMTLSYNGHNPTRLKLDGDDVSWATSTLTARFAVLYKDNAGNGLTSPAICWVDFGSDQSSSSGTFEIQWNSSGIVEISSPWT